MAFRTDDVVLSHIRRASQFRAYGGTTAVFEVNGAWLVLVMGAAHADQPGWAMT